MRVGEVFGIGSRKVIVAVGKCAKIECGAVMVRTPDGASALAEIRGVRERENGSDLLIFGLEKSDIPVGSTLLLKSAVEKG